MQGLSYVKHCWNVRDGAFLDVDSTTWAKGIFLQTFSSCKRQFSKSERGTLPFLEQV